MFEVWFIVVVDELFNVFILWLYVCIFVDVMVIGLSCNYVVVD